MPKDMRCKEIIDGLYEVTGYDYMTTSKVNKRMREKTYTGKYMDLKNALDRFFNIDEVNGKQPIFGEVFSPEDVAQIAEGATYPCVK